MASRQWHSEVDDSRKRPALHVADLDQMKNRYEDSSLKKARIEIGYSKDGASCQEHHEKESDCVVLMSAAEAPAHERIGAGPKPPVATEAVLVDDVLSIVLGMLHPREMLRLASCSKFLMGMLTRKLVMHNAILSGGHAMVSMKHMMRLMTEGKIHLPSPARLLRIANGLRCELPGCENVVHTVRPHFGLFVCWSCFRKGNVTGQVSTASQRWNECLPLQTIVTHDKTAHYAYMRKYFIWARPFITSDAERAGPVVTMHSVEGFLGGQKDETRGGSDTTATGIDSTDNTQLADGENEGVDGAGGVESETERDRNDPQSVDDFIESLVAFEDEERKAKLESLAGVCEEAHKTAAKNKAEDCMNRVARVHKFRTAKAAAFQSKLNEIKAMMDPRWSPFALNFWWYSSAGRSRDFQDEYNPKFESSLVCTIPVLVTMARAPAKVSQKLLIRTADKIDKIFQPIFDAGFHDFSFLGTECAKNAFGASLREGLREKYGVEAFVLSLTEEDVERLKCHGPLMALAMKLSNEDQCHWKPPSCFAISVLVRANLEPRQTDEAFARALWLIKTPENEWEANLHSFSETCNQVYQNTLEAFLTARNRILRYVQHPDTIGFLNSGDGRNPEWLRVKREEVERVWVDRSTLLSFLNGEVNFEVLRRTHHSNAQRRWLGGRW